MSTKFNSTVGRKHIGILVDSCVCIDSFDPASPNHEESLKLMEALADRNAVVIMPAHGYFEVQCNLQRLRKEGRFAIPAIDPQKQYSLKLIHINDEFITKYKAADLPYIKAGDHIFLAVAKVDDISLITSDAKLISAAKGAGVSVFTPGEALAELQK